MEVSAELPATCRDPELTRRRATGAWWRATAAGNGNAACLHTYDVLNRVLFTQSQRAINVGASQATDSFAYDAVSNPIAVIDANSNRRATLYDLMNRPTTFTRRVREDYRVGILARCRR